MHTETLTWRCVASEMPDADLVVNVAIVGGEEPVWLGAFDGEVWRDTEGMEISVTHWAPMLAGPAAAGITAGNSAKEWTPGVTAVAPAGYKLVPLSPTVAMVDAGLAEHDTSAAPEDEMAGAYRAMVAAAPGVGGTDGR